MSGSPTAPVAVASPPAPWRRSFGVSAAAVLLAAAAHTASGMAPGVLPVAAAGVLTVALVRRFAARERSLVEIGALLGLGQVVCHVTFEAPYRLPGASPLFHVGAAPGGALAIAGAHLVAAVVAAWWLRRGEAALWRLARRAETAAGRLLGLAGHAVPGGVAVAVRGAAAGASPYPVRRRPLADGATRRGPLDRLSRPLTPP